MNDNAVDYGEMLRQEKLFYERFWALHRDPQLTEIFKAFGPEAFRRSSVLEGFSAFVVDNDFAGRRCVEIGTLNGLTALVLARHFMEVVTVDIMDGPMRYDISQFCGRSARNIKYVVVRDNTEKAAFLGDLHFDAAYVDGNHTDDTDKDFDLVKRCGRVLFHEYWKVQPSVWHLVNSLRTQGAVVDKGKLALWTQSNSKHA